MCKTIKETPDWDFIDGEALVPWSTGDTIIEIPRALNKVHDSEILMFILHVILKNSMCILNILKKLQESCKQLP